MTPTELARLPRHVREAMYRRAGEEIFRRRHLKKEDPAIWARAFAGRPIEFIGEVMGDSWWTGDWAAWRAYVKTVFGVPIVDATELEIFRSCTGLQEQPPGATREIWTIVGRRGGKSRIIALIAVYLAVCFDWTPYLAPGERGFSKRALGGCG